MANETIDKIIQDLRMVEHIMMSFQKSAKVPDIERDIALSKLRNVYEFIQLLEVERPEKIREKVMTPSVVVVAEEMQVVKEDIMDIEFDSVAPPEMLLSNNGAPTSVDIPQPRPDEIPVPAPSGPEIPRPAEVPVQKPGEVPPPKPPEIPVPKSVEVIPEQHVHVHTRKTETTTILAEKFQKDKSFLNEALAKYQNHSNISLKYQTKPIQDIFTAISLNEKYLYIKELFNNDPAQYKNTIDKLNAFNDFNQAVAYLDQQFKWDFNDFQVQKIIELVHRRYLPAGE